MKEGWKMVKLGEICETTAGGTPSKTHKEYYEGGKIPWMLSGEVCQKYIYEVEHYITSEGLENSSAKLFPINSVVVAMYGATAGQVGILKIETSTNQAVCGILPNDKMSPEFLYYYFLYYKDILVAQAVGNAQPNISQQKIKAVEIPLLSLEEQHRIVGILDAAFAKIDALKANAEANLANAKALFQQVLAQELKPKEGWVEKKLGEVCEITSSKRIFKNEYTENGIPFYRTKELKELAHGRNISLELFISESRYNDIKAKFGVPQIGDILISAVGTIGETLIIDNVNPFYFKDGNIVWLRKINGVNSNFLKISIDSIVEKLKSITRGAAYNALTIEKLKEMQIIYPILEEEQINILFTIQTLSEKCRCLEQVAQQTIRECDALKQSILRQAFSGEL